MFWLFCEFPSLHFFVSLFLWLPYLTLPPSPPSWLSLFLKMLWRFLAELLFPANCNFFFFSFWDVFVFLLNIRKHPWWQTTPKQTNKKKLSYTYRVRMETLWFLSGEVGTVFSSGQNKIHSHKILNIFLFEMTFQVSSHNDIMFSGTSSPNYWNQQKYQQLKTRSL